MTALAGRWNLDGRPDAAADCARMLTAQKIYGPHDGAQWSDATIAIGRRLYRTLPEDAFDRQPLSGTGGRYRMVADVRLDNRDALAAELGIDAASAKRMSDADVLLAAWVRWEDDVFAHLYGDYAFAVWDARDRRLVLARDALGARPLHYHRGDGFVAFASMPKGLHALADIPYGPDEERIAELLALLPEYGSQSFFRDVARVDTGHVVTHNADGTTVHRHWEPRRETLKLANLDAYDEALRQHLDDAVRARLRGAEARIGTHLSGGWDSSAVTATAARMMPPGGQVFAFTSVPREGYDLPSSERRIGDEGPLAAATAALYPNVEHVLVRPDGSGTLEQLDRDFFLFERPVLNICNMQWNRRINDEARARGLDVVLTGQMGNMTISYNGNEHLPELIARGRWWTWLREGRALVKTKRYRWRGLLVASFGPWLPGPLWTLIHRLANKPQYDINEYSAIRPDRYDALDLATRAREQSLDPSYRPRKNGFETRLWVMRRTDPGNYNKGILAGWGIDMRDPTSDRRLVEFCLSLPMGVYLSGGQTRALGMRALADRLPADVLIERRKGQQAIDWHEGATASRDQLREEIERLTQVESAATALDLARMRRLIDDWPSEGWDRAEIISQYRLALLRGTASGHFLRKASRSNA
jgi:asparagine synthase (glutamine-hydrolysing)